MSFAVFGRRREDEPVTPDLAPAPEPPVAAPVVAPVVAPVAAPVAAPVVLVEEVPVAEPVAEPFAEPFAEPVAEPTPELVAEPVAEPTARTGLSPVSAVGEEMEPDLADHWDLWSVQLGKVLAPRLRTISDRIPTLTSALVTTLDGLHLCAVGVDERQVDALSALASSMHSVCAAGVAVLDGAGPESVTGSGRDAGADPALDLISLHHGSRRTVVVAVPGLVVGTALLWMTADEGALGMLLIQARSTAEAIRGDLGADSPTSPSETAVPLHRTTPVAADL